MTALFANASAADHAMALVNSLALAAAVLLIRFIAQQLGASR